MRRSLLTLSALLLLALPHAAGARTPVLEVPSVAAAGQRLEIHWGGLAESVCEVELELSLDGGRWVRISPELEARERRYSWFVPAVTSAHARLRLRVGGEGFEGEIAASGEFRIACGEPTAGPNTHALDGWLVAEHAGAPGWAPGPPTATLSNDCTASAAEPDSRSQASAAALTSVCEPLDRRSSRSAPCPANADPAATRRCPLRL